MDSILIIAGENSGEKYGADLVRQFKKLHPSFTFFGIGGKHMAKEGVEILFSVNEFGIVGGFEVLSHLFRIKRIFNQVKNEVKQRQPVASVLIDSPDFNLRLAKKLKKQSIPILYYISPTVWAWRRGRLKPIKKTIEKMMLIFPFEEKIYKGFKIPAVYVGHPLQEKVRSKLTRQEFLEKYSLDPQKKLIALLPGSRRSEFKNHMPVLAKAIHLIKNEWDTHFFLLLAEGLDKKLISDFLPLLPDNLNVLTENHYEAIAASGLVLSACGTANLEAALLGTPLLAFYRISPLTYSLGRRLAHIDNFSIVNILAGKRIIPELIQRDLTPENIFQESKRILESEETRSEMISHFRRIKKILGEKTASQNAAKELQKIIFGDVPQGATS
ncbi:MAG: lipid-A-disaccharide synthase [Candidatus Aminicenantes bacterium]|nr:MAG: lipid-A-disaccharide synthase [Candidatus Aminicenantes bacterium]